jgi:DNA repair protein RecO (recombination protein O)
MPSIRDRAICLRKFEYSETSQILTLLTRSHGLVRVIAKGAHRRTKAGSSKFDGGIDLLDTGDCVFIEHTSRELSTLTEWKLIEGHLSLRQSLRALLLGQTIAEVVTLLFPEHTPHAMLYGRLRATLPILGTDRIEEHFLALLIDAINDAGYLPELDRCFNCGNEITDRVFFSPARGGAICRACEQNFPDRREIDFRLLRIVDGILKLPRERGVVQRLPRLTRHQTDPLIALLLSHTEHVIQRPLRTRAYLAN